MSFFLFSKGDPFEIPSIVLHLRGKGNAISTATTSDWKWLLDMEVVHGRSPMTCMVLMLALVQCWWTDGGIIRCWYGNQIFVQSKAQELLILKVYAVLSIPITINSDDWHKIPLVGAILLAVLRPLSLKSYKALAQTCRLRWRREIVGMKHWFISSRFRWIRNFMRFSDDPFDWLPSPFGGCSSAVLKYFMIHPSMNPSISQS